MIRFFTSEFTMPTGVPPLNDGEVVHRIVDWSWSIDYSIPSGRPECATDASNISDIKDFLKNWDQYVVRHGPNYDTTQNDIEIFRLPTGILSPNENRTIDPAEYNNDNVKMLERATSSNIFAGL